MSLTDPFRSIPSLALVGALSGVVLVTACKRSEPPVDPLKTQRDAMQRAKDVGNTMQKSVDAEGKKADEDSQ